MYATRFDELFERGRDAVLAGAVQCQVPPVNGGDRWVMSVVMRPDAATARSIGEITREAMSVAGEGHWPTGTADSSHFTLRALEKHRLSVPDGDARVSRRSCATDGGESHRPCSADPVGSDPDTRLHHAVRRAVG